MDRKTSILSDYDALLSSYYGGGPAHRRHRRRRSGYSTQPDAKRPVPTALSLSMDDGEVLVAPGGATDTPEYVVSSPQPVGAPPAAPVEPPARPALPVSPVAPEPTALRIPEAPETPRPPEPELPPLASGPDRTDEASGPLSETELLADMQRILSGQASWDPEARKVTDTPPRRLPSDDAPPVPSGLPMSSEHAFFDQLAASMEYANAYDLGTLELQQQKFGDFDRMATLKQQAASLPPSAAAFSVAAPRPAAPTASPSTVRDGDPLVGSAEFIRDLDAISAAHSVPMAYGVADDPKGRWSDLPGWNTACAPTTLSLSDDDDPHSVAMYDTGERVLAAGNLYPDALRVGAAPGVLLSYGQVVAMGGDLVSAPETMMSMPAADLLRLKSLVERSTKYYEGKKSDKRLDVSNSEWDDATHGQYLVLADKNDDHFAPHTLPLPFAPNNPHTNHKAAWEFFHGSAIEEAQRYYLANPSGTFPEQALIRNAFADHFLTDAFSAGHLFNKEVLKSMFRQNFYLGAALNPGGERFFERMAKKAFVGEVAQKFSALETADYPVCVWGLCLKWHPDINSADRFASLLKAAATQQPDKISNLVVKALHDDLNERGYMVSNAAGRSWHLKGDGHLTAETKAIMQVAVGESAATITDPAIRVSGIDVAALHAKVWRHTPQPTPASVKDIVRLAHEYTNTDSDRLVNAAAEILSGNVNSLIKELLDQKKLKKA
ncbi:hypothetical protein [Nocardioides zhouii]|uniref:Uncharacterized protein n=1 Tax=Nocardioides zhouii TaxID=1168729 RepID=A0A4Q2SI73_9ACTN|nr:hypothetical protein [Nocardioides zhouii]RYC05226.1 hypothetical protein EUA94_19860 [Nocardioides zhouii]